MSQEHPGHPGSTRDDLLPRRNCTQDEWLKRSKRVWGSVFNENFAPGKRHELRTYILIDISLVDWNCTFPHRKIILFWLSILVQISMTSQNHCSRLWSHQITQIKARKHKGNFSKFCFSKSSSLENRSVWKGCVPENHRDWSHQFLENLEYGISTLENGMQIWICSYSSKGIHSRSSKNMKRIF